MPTEREVIHQIMDEDPEGIQALLTRYGGLFQEGLTQYYKDREADWPELLERSIRDVAGLLRSGAFDDIVETFYNWLVRNVWTVLIGYRQEEDGGPDHVDPADLYQCAHPLNEKALPEEIRTAARTHLESCPLCPALLEPCKDVSILACHPGSDVTDTFDAVRKQALDAIVKK